MEEFQQQEKLLKVKKKLKVCTKHLLLQLFVKLTLICFDLLLKRSQKLFNYKNKK